MTTIQLEAERLRGTWRRFGPFGPVYEIIGLANHNEIGQTMTRVRVIESGEEIDYRIDEILDDPRER